MPIIFLDDNSEVKSCGSYKVIGGCKNALKYKNADFIIAIGNSNIRQKMQSEFIDSALHIVSLKE
ncbi:PglD-related sugar-binding protein [Hungatella hathewayi]